MNINKYKNVIYFSNKFEMFYTLLNENMKVIFNVELRYILRNMI